MIVFLTTTNLPTNPRLVKEIDLLSKQNQIIVICFKLGNWSDPLNQKMISERLNIRFVELDSTRSNFCQWLTWALIEKGSRFVWTYLKSNLLITALAHSRRSLMLRKEAKKNITHPKRIIAHNLGALYPAYCLAKKWKIPFHYDIEDYDPGIAVRNGGRHYVSICEQLMKSCLPSSIALTSASPLIREYTLKLIGGHPNHQVIFNSFPSNEFQPPSEKDRDILKLVWFSQKISFGRGIEQLIEAFKLLIKHQYENYEKDLPISLTLIGDIDSRFHKQILQPALKSVSAIKIEIIPPMNQSELHKNLANYDVGLALEPGKDLNNNLAISNKIIAYAQAGLYILATDTPAQNQFMKEDTERGLVCGQSTDDMIKALKHLVSANEKIKSNAMQRFEKGKELAWEKEQEKLVNIWNDYLNVSG